MKFVVVGGAHPDRIARASRNLQGGASNHGTLHENIGGAGFNAAFALRIFGVAVSFIGVRGGDHGSMLVENALDKIGVTDRSAVMLDRATASYTAILDADGELHAAIADTAIYDCVSARLLRRGSARRTLQAAGAILLDANLPEEAIAGLAASQTAPIVAIGVSPAKAVRFRSSASRLSALFVSRREAAALTERDASAPVEDLAAALRGLGFARAIVSDGASPSAILDGDSICMQSAPTVDRVLDVTGAGDTLAAVAMLGWCEGLSFAEAGRRGMAAAALRITGRLVAGCRPACESIAAVLRAPSPVLPRDLP